MTKTCKRINSLLFSYAAGELSVEESGSVAAHVRECCLCARRLEACARLREGFSLLREREEPRDVWKGYWDEIEEAVQEHRSPWLGWRPVAATAAAAVLILLLTQPLWQWRRGSSKAPAEEAWVPKEEYCVVHRAEAGDPSANLMIYKVDEARLTVIWLMESPGEERRSSLEMEAIART
ncbi:MAG: hypothetical protein P9M00_12635 [Candidatus Tritonobacter lacicola]|nr:hypothetical protein [Candidatus Tritonobacter lacicola]